MFGQHDLNSTENTVNPVISPTASSVPAVPSMAGSVPNNPVIPQASVSAFNSMPADQPAAAAPVAVPSFTNTPPMPDDTTADDLVNMKQEALKHLQPLVDTLQQSPEEEFRTIMMMIQATDDKTMLKKALDSAKKITDDKIRAQAMLDVINEINYFTQTSQE